MLELHVPKLKPASCDTWEIRDTLAVADAETARLTLDFPAPYLIVGFYASVIATELDTDLKDPTTDDFLVLLDLNNQRRFTASNNIGQTSAASRNQEYATLSALNTQFRDVQIEMVAERPTIGVTFRWKLGDAAARAALYNPALIALSFFCTPLKGR